jgi:hypothetical protein
MTLEDYLISPVAKTIGHPVIVDGLRVECDLIGCNYVEYFPTYDDAQIGAEVHEGSR